MMPATGSDVNMNGTRVVSNAAMAEIDLVSRERYGLSSSVLMEAAGLKAWTAARALLWNGGLPDGPVVFAAGRGNNGGDALVMARHAFVDGVRSICVVLVSSGLSGDAEKELETVLKFRIPVCSYDSEKSRAETAVREARYLFDGLAGTGLKGPLRPPASELASLINGSSARVIAIDLPSGLYDGYARGEPAVQADFTITMGRPKLCMYLPAARVPCGEIGIVDPGFPPELFSADGDPYVLLEDGDLPSLLPRIGLDTYKNRRGTVAVFAGSPGTTGAAALCAEASLRSRAGLVSLFSDDGSYLPLASKLTSVMVKPWDSGSAPDGFDFSRFSAILAGPGWGTGANRSAWLSAFFRTGLPGVLDADGIRLLAAMARSEPVNLGSRWVLTPHPGEFELLAGGDGRSDAPSNPVPPLLETARRLNAVVILKGHVSLIGTPDGKLGILDGMNPALATGGSGDILAGIIAGFLSAGIDAETAAQAALLLQRRIGRSAFADLGWFIAEDLLPYISRELVL